MWLMLSGTLQRQARGMKLYKKAKARDIARSKPLGFRPISDDGCSSSKELFGQDHVRSRATSRPSRANDMTRQVLVINDDHPAAEQMQYLEELLVQDPEWLAQHPEFLDQSSAGRPPEMMVALEETTAYQYKPLEDGQIRLVALHPGQGNAPLMCSLMPMQLESGPRMDYEALSYAWGDPTGLRKMRCNDNVLCTSEDGRVFSAFPFGSDESIQISPNLEAALYRLRVEDDFRMLWIDAICIDQSKIEERSDQVQRMSEIYGSADGVVVWLGEENETSKLAFECVDRLNEMKDWLYENFPDPDKDERLQVIGLQPWSLNPGSPGFLSREVWSAFRTLMRKSTWFVRAWTFQEVVMAIEATVICGSLSRSWDELVGACKLASEYRMGDADRAMAFYNEGEDAYLMIQQVVQRGRIHSSLRSASSTNAALDWTAYFLSVQFESLLIGTRLAEATDPRDKVYSVLSLAHGRDLLPKVDYSLDVRDVYLQVAKYWVQAHHENSQNIGTFFGSVQMANPQHRLPSWVVDWSSPPNAALLRLPDVFVSSGNTILSFRFVEYVPSVPSRGAFNPAELTFLDFQQEKATGFFPSEDNDRKPVDLKPSLCVRGVVLLTIKAADRRRTLSDTAKHLELMNSFADPYPTTSKPYIEIYPKIVNPQKPEDYRRESETGVPGFWEHTRKFEQEELEGRNGQLEGANKRRGDNPNPYLPPHQARTKEDLKVPELFEAIGSMNGPFGVYSRSFFVTTNGFMGLGPIRTAPGDQICILYGCPCPFVVRPLSTPGRYWLVGECYVYGLLSGEAMEGLPAEKVQDLSFD